MKNRIILLFILLFSSCSRYGEFSSAKVVVSNAAIFTDDVLLYGYNDEGAKFSKKFSPREETFIELDVGEWVFFGVAAGGGTSVLCTYFETSLIGPEDNIEVFFNEENCGDFNLTNQDYLGRNGRPVPVEFSICENFDDVNFDSLTCGANGADDTQSVSIWVDSPNGQIDLGCFEAPLGKGSFNINFPLPKFFEEGIELRFTGYNQPNCIDWAGEMHLLDGLKESYFIQHNISEVSGEKKLYLLFDLSPFHVMDAFDFFDDHGGGEFFPPGGGEFIPPGDGGFVPPGDGGFVPPGDGGVVPPGDGGFVPPGDGGFVPPGDGGFVPPGDGGVVPPGDGGVVPPGDGGVVPPENGVAAPPENGVVIPPGNGGNLPPVNNAINRNITMPTVAALIVGEDLNDNPIEGLSNITSDPYPEFIINDLLPNSEGLIFNDSACINTSVVGEFHYDISHLVGYGYITEKLDLGEHFFYFGLLDNSNSLVGCSSILSTPLQSNIMPAIEDNPHYVYIPYGPNANATTNGNFDAGLIIDDDDLTYYQTLYSIYNTPDNPNFFRIDLGEEVILKGIDIVIGSDMFHQALFSKINVRLLDSSGSEIYNLERDEGELLESWDVIEGSVEVDFGDENSEFFNVREIIIEKRPNDFNNFVEGVYSFLVQDVYLYGLEQDYLNEVVKVHRNTPHGSISETVEKGMINISLNNIPDVGGYSVRVFNEETCFNEIYSSGSLASGTSSVSFSYNYSNDYGPISFWVQFIDPSGVEGECSEISESINLVKYDSYKGIDIASGSNHTCAVVNPGHNPEDNTVRCWGNNNYGQLGYGDNQPRGDTENEIYNLPAVDLGLTYFYDEWGMLVSDYPIKVSAESNHSCVLTNLGRVKCWGYNVGGITGIHNNGEPIGDDPGEVRNIPFLYNGGAIGITSGKFHNCALLEGDFFGDEYVECWGRNGNKQLGLGDRATNAFIGDAVNEFFETDKRVDIDTNFYGRIISLKAKNAVSCVVTEHGYLICWGKNNKGQLGRNINIPHSGFPQPVQLIDQFGNYVFIKNFAVGTRHICAATVDDRLKCWGSNYFANDSGVNVGGVLGHGNNDDTYIGDDPDEMDDLNIPDTNLGNTADEILDISASEHTCVTHSEIGNTDNFVRCFGRNTYTELGHDVNDPSYESYSSSNANFPFTYYGDKVTTGDNFTCAIINSEDQAIRCWGRQYNGNLGLPVPSNNSHQPNAGPNIFFHSVINP